MQPNGSNFAVVQASVLEGLPAWITAEAVADTLRTFGPLYPDGLTVDEAVAILVNVGNIFNLLRGEAIEQRNT